MDYVKSGDTGWERKYYTGWNHKNEASEMLRKFVTIRARGWPLQYFALMGAHFCDLTIRCAPGMQDRNHT